MLDFDSKMDSIRYVVIFELKHTFNKFSNKKNIFIPQADSNQRQTMSVFEIFGMDLSGFLTTSLGSGFVKGIT